MSRSDELLHQMTCEEKISMLARADLWHSFGVPRPGIPQFKLTEGPNGARGAWGDMGPQSVATPVGIALGATGNPDLIGKVGNVRADAVKAKGAHILLAPTVNIHRTPIAGRNFECFAEDPFLIGSSSRDIRLCGKFILTASNGSRLHIGLPLKTLLEDEAGHGVLAQHFGGMLETPMIQMGREMSLEQISKLVPDMLTSEKLKAINDDLAKAS